MAGTSTTLAVLIDADNAQPAVVDGLLAEIAKYGTATVKRIYGDWTGPQLKGWKETLLTHAIQPIQQFRYTTGKNATDSALIIDAMDLLYTGRLGGFCIVSSDSDFTRLAARIREAGLVVYGFGEKKTPAPFVSACDKFIYTEILLAKDDDGDATLKPRSAAQLQAGPPPGRAAAQRGRSGVRRCRLVAARHARQHDRQAGAGVRRAQLRLSQAQRTDRGERPVRHREAQDRRRLDDFDLRAQPPARDAHE